MNNKHRVDVTQLVEQYKTYYAKYPDQQEELGLDWTPAEYKDEIKRRYITETIDNEGEKHELITKFEAKEWTFCFARFFNFDESLEFPKLPHVDMSDEAILDFYQLYFPEITLQTIDGVEMAMVDDLKRIKKTVVSENNAAMIADEETEIFWTQLKKSVNDELNISTSRLSIYEARCLLRMMIIHISQSDEQWSQLKAGSYEAYWELVTEGEELTMNRILAIYRAYKRKTRFRWDFAEYKIQLTTRYGFSGKGPIGKRAAREWIFTFVYYFDTYVKILHGMGTTGADQVKYLCYNIYKVCLLSNCSVLHAV